MSEEAIGRLRHTDGVPYFFMSRLAAQGLIGTPEVLGLLTYLLSLPEDWKIYSTHLAKQTGVSDRTIRRWLVVLRDAGYVRRRKLRRDDGSVLGHVIEVRPDVTVGWPGEPADSHAATRDQPHAATGATCGSNVRHTKNTSSSTENIRPRISEFVPDQSPRCDPGAAVSAIREARERLGR